MTLARLRAPDGTLASVHALISGRAERIRNAVPPPLSGQLAGASRLDQLAAYAVSQGDARPVVAILKLGVRGIKFRPGPLADGVLSAVASSFGDPLPVAEAFEQLVAATALDAIDNAVAQGRMHTQLAVSQPGAVERRVVEALGNLQNELASFRGTEPAPGRVPVDAVPEQVLDEHAANEDRAARAQQRAEAIANAKDERTARTLQVFNATPEEVRKMFPSLTDDEFDALLDRRAPAREAVSAPAWQNWTPEKDKQAVPDCPGIYGRLTKNGVTFQAIVKGVDGGTQGGFATVEEALEWRENKLAEKAAA